MQTLGLQPGERVRVKRKEEIVATLDANNANRGMSFDGEMLRYCGQEARVLRRVERIIDEKTGRMLRFKNPCIVLDDVTCTGGLPPPVPARHLPVLAGDLAGAGGMSRRPVSPPSGRAPDRGGRERGPHGQPLRRHAPVVDLRQLEQPQHLAGLGPPPHPQPAVGARQDELVVPVGLPAPDGALRHDAAERRLGRRSRRSP